jgi:hypothetical protein
MSSRSEKAPKPAQPTHRSDRRRRAPALGAVARTAPPDQETPADTAGPGTARTGSRNDTGLIEVTFAYAAGSPVEGVQVAGDFNGWDASAQPLKSVGGGVFEAKVRLPPGEHQYKFVVAGNWVEDPAAEQQTPNGFGTRNSVVQVRPTPGSAPSR